MCGIVGVASADGDAERLAFAGLVSLQHRGHESWGLAARRGDGIAPRRELGFARWPSDGEEDAPAAAAIGHVRYSTTGASRIENAQPFAAGGRRRRVAIAHNGNVTNAVALAAQLRSAGWTFRSTSDSEVILALLATAPGDAPDAVAAALDRLEGAVTVVALVDDALLAFRDAHGFRPLVVGEREGMAVAASETCALDALGAGRQREVAPGELVALTPAGVAGSWRVAPPAPRRLCVFEHVYLSRRDSRTDGEPLEAVRVRLGERLALESPADADAVVPVPASGVPAARGYARAAGLPLREALVRNEYVGRSFIQPTPALRELAVRMKFNVAGDLDGRRVVVVDDSIVRGSTMRHVVALLRGAGAREVHVRIAAPPVVSACHYGVDIGAPGELLAAHRRFDAVRDAIGATSLEYLSVAGLRAAVGAGARRGLCDACLTRREPAAAPAAA